MESLTHTAVPRADALTNLGWQEFPFVPTLPQLAALDAPNGQKEIVIGASALYMLDTSSTATPDGIQVVARTNGGTGRWLLLNFELGLDMPFKGKYYIDPSSANVETGSEASPFRSLFNAQVAVAALGLASASYIVASGAALSESIVLPAIGNWEIRGAQPNARPTLTGTVTTASGPTQASYSFTDINITGNVLLTTSCASGTFFTLTRSNVTGNVALSATGSGFWWPQFDGGGSLFSFFAFGGGVSGTTSVVGGILASGYYFGGLVTLNSVSFFKDCTHAGDINAGAGGNISLANSGFIGLRAITGTAGAVGLLTDALTESNMASSGATLSNVVWTSAGRQSRRGTVSGNVGTTNITNAHMPAGMYEIVATGEVLTTGGGGASGSLAISVSYTDFSGSVATEALTSFVLSATAAVGTKTRGALAFSHKGGAVISYVGTGISAAGAFTANLGVTLRRLE